MTVNVTEETLFKLLVFSEVTCKNVWNLTRKIQLKIFLTPSTQANHVTKALLN